MKKIFEHIEYARVGHYQAILDSEGIATTVRNLGASSGAGEIPFHEVFPELWVVEDADYDRALALLEDYQPPDASALTDWTCPKCGEAVEREFGECWNCGTMRPQPIGDSAPQTPDSDS